MFLKIREKKGPPPETLFEQESLTKEARMPVLSQNVIKIRNIRAKTGVEMGQNTIQNWRKLFLKREAAFFSPALMEMVTSKGNPEEGRTAKGSRG